jgi:hypothetical protein
MASERETMRVQVTLKRELGEKIEELADRLGVSESKMVEFLLEAAVEQNEIIIRAVTSKWGIALKEILTGQKISKGRVARERAAKRSDAKSAME